MGSKLKLNPVVIATPILILLFVYLNFRNLGLYPTVFADEYAYSKLSRLQPLSESTVPGYLYLFIYGLTNVCGNGFLACAKLFNSIFFISAAPFIYLTARRVASRGLSVFVSLVVVAGPVNSYTAYFMPESLYFLSFWVFSWYLLGLTGEAKQTQWFIAGVIYAASALIKPHSLFFLPSILIYISLVFFQSQCLVSKRSIYAMFFFVFGALITKFGISYILAGSPGLTLFGPLYGSIAQSTASETEKYSRLLTLAFDSLTGHILVMVLIYSVPIVLAILVSVGSLRERYKRTNDSVVSQSTEYENLVLFSILVILNLVCVVAIFTASVASSGPYETPYRLHMRYYNFALPLFYLVAAGALSSPTDVKRPMSYIIGCIFMVIGIYAVWTNLAPYTPSFVDSPEIRGLSANYLLFQIVGGLLIGALALWLIAQRLGIRFYLYFVLPVFILVSTSRIGLELGNRSTPDLYDNAGIITKQYLNDEDLPRVLVVGSEVAALLRTLFHLSDAGADLEIIERGAAYDLTKLPDGKEWLLVVGDHDVKGNRFYQLDLKGFKLIRASGEIAVDFRKEAWPGIITRVNGLSLPEAWGTWSQSNEVLFEFTNPLPQAFELHLVARAFVPNVGKDFFVSVGGEPVSFTLPVRNEQRSISLRNPNGSRFLKFSIPNAISPMALGMSNDDRNLGIGFKEMKIVPVD